MYYETKALNEGKRITDNPTVPASKSKLAFAKTCML